jgi:hypothetical protein
VRSSHIRRLSALILLALVIASTLTSCEDKVSTLAAPFYADTVQLKTTVRNDLGFMQMRTLTVSKIPVGGITHNITLYSPLLLIGRVATEYENVESWGVLQFPVLPDTTFAKVASARLLLRDQNYRYGDSTTTPNRVDFQLYEYSPVANTLLDSTTILSKSQLKAIPAGVFQNDFADKADSVLALAIDTSMLADLKSASLAFVVTPGNTMTNVRGFGTMQSSDTNARPSLEYTLKDGSKVAIRPTTEFHVVSDMSPALPADEFSLRGSLGMRVFDTLALTRPTDSAQLSRFSTINSAELVLTFDPLRSRHSSFALDTAGPAIVRLTSKLSEANIDTGAVLPFPSTGYFVASDTTYHFQIRGILEYWLRNPGSNFGFELRAGYLDRAFSPTNQYGVEDNSINRWTFYGQNATDITKRPKLILSYSRLP